jgi:4-amino-4-deoxy-L-arabinose transferase-like glycosyltransferase
MRDLSRFRVRLAAIAAGALGLRLLYVLVLARDVPMAGDSQFFHAVPKLISEGHGFIEPFVFVKLGIEAPTAAHPPLYPLVLSALSVVGIDGALAQRALGALTGALVVVLIGLLGRRLGGARAGLAAAAIAALYPVLVEADGALMSESLYGVFVVGALLAALRLRERRDVPSAALIGGLIGLAALTRSEALLLLVLLAVPLSLRGDAWRAARLAAAAGACLLVLAPWTIRNVSAFHELTLISHNDSTVAAGANCPATYRGKDLGSWRFDCIPPRTTFREGVQADRWRRHGLDYVKDHAGRLPAVVPVRVLRTWDLWQPRRQVVFAESRARWADRAGIVAYFLLLPFAVAGGLLLRRERRGELLVLLAPLALVTISSAVGYGLPRFRHAAEPTLVVLAAVGLMALADRVRARRRSAAAPA